MLESLFHLKANGTSVRTETRAGLVTFITMSYIIFVQPAVMQGAGMDFGAVMTATCLASALATLVMGLVANYPIALAPCMGENFFFAAVATGAVTGTAVGWRAALAAVFVSGAVFLLLSAFHLREKIFDSIPLSLKYAISAGIGLFVAFIGLVDGGIVTAGRGTPLALGNLASRPVALALGGLLLTAILAARRFPGALLAGPLVTAIVGIPLGVVKFQGVVETPPSLAPVLFRLDLASLADLSMVTVAAIFLFMVLFDTIGTLIGVAMQAGLLREGRLERAGRALLADAVGTTAGALMGSSTVSSYIESAAGVSAGGRTGLANMVTAALFLGALFFSPLVRMVGGGVPSADGGAVLYPVTAAALVVVGFFMAGGIRNIPWNEPADAIPAFLTVIGIPLTWNIADGIALGFVSFAILKIATGRAREVSALVYAMAVLLTLLYILKTA